MEQVWFSGSQPDIGDGFKEPGLSDITLRWMVEKAVSHGLRIYLGSREYWNFVVAPDPTEQYYPPRKNFAKIYKKIARNTIFKHPIQLTPKGFKGTMPPGARPLSIKA